MLHSVTIFDGGLPWHLSRPDFNASVGVPWDREDVRAKLNDPRGILSVSSAQAPSGDLHVCAIDGNRILLHTIRTNDGSWPFAWGDVQAETNRIGPNPGVGPIRMVACALDGSSQLHVCAIDMQGGLWHTIREPDGTWPFRFGDVQAETSRVGPNPGIGRVVSVACAVNALSELHVCVLDAQGDLWHTMRNSDGIWPFAFGDVQAQTRLVGPNPGIGALSTISCASDGNQLHLCVIDRQANEIWHTTRDAGGRWPFAFGNVQAEAGILSGSPAPVGSVACAAQSGRLHVLATTAATGRQTDGFLGHTIREQSGTWQSWGDVTKQSHAVGRALQVSAAVR